MSDKPIMDGERQDEWGWDDEHKPEGPWDMPCGGCYAPGSEDCDWCRFESVCAAAAWRGYRPLCEAEIERRFELDLAVLTGDSPVTPSPEPDATGGGQGGSDA